MCIKDLGKPFRQLTKAPMILILLIVVNLILSFAVSDALLNTSFDFANAVFTVLGMGQPLVAVPATLYMLYPALINMLILYGFVGFFLTIFTFAIVAVGVKSEKQGAPLLSELVLLIKRLPGLFSLSILLFLLSAVAGLFFLVLFQVFILIPNMGILTTIISLIFAIMFAVIAVMYVVKLFVAIPAFVMNVDLKPQKAIRASLEFSRGKYLHIFLLVLAVSAIVTVVFNLLSFVVINLDEPLLSISLAVINGILAWYMFLVPSYYYSENK